MLDDPEQQAADFGYRIADHARITGADAPFTARVLLAASQAIKEEAAGHPEWNEYVKMVHELAKDYQWSVAPWVAWRMADDDMQELVALMLYRKPCSQTCLAELATVAQTTVQAVVEAMEAGERDGFVRWDGDRQMVIISIPGEGDIELCDGHA